MSTYTTCETALLACVRAIDGGATFTTGNSSRADFAVLDAPGGVSCVLMQAGRSEYGDTLGGGRGTHGRRQQRHRIAAIVFVQRGTGAGGDAVAVATLHDLTDRLCAWLDTRPRLGSASSVKRAQVVECGEPTLRRSSPHVFAPLLVEILTETEPALIEGPQ